MSEQRSFRAERADRLGKTGGIVDEILKRLGIVETTLAGVVAVIPHLATKADVAELKAEMKTSESIVIKWVIATGLSSAALSTAIAKLLG